MAARSNAAKKMASKIRENMFTLKISRPPSLEMTFPSAEEESRRYQTTWNKATAIVRTASNPGRRGDATALYRVPPRNHGNRIDVPGTRNVPFPKFGMIIINSNPTNTVNSGPSASIMSESNPFSVDISGTSQSEERHGASSPHVHHVEENPWHDTEKDGECCKKKHSNLL